MSEQDTLGQDYCVKEPEGGAAEWPGKKAIFWLESALFSRSGRRSPYQVLLCCIAFRFDARSTANCQNSGGKGPSMTEGPIH